MLPAIANMAQVSAPISHNQVGSETQGPIEEEKDDKNCDQEAGPQYPVNAANPEVFPS